MSEQNFVKTAIDPVSKANWLEREFEYSISIGGKSIGVKVTLWAVIAVILVLVMAGVAIGLICMHLRHVKRQQEKNDAELAKQIQSAVDQGLTLPPELLEAAERNKVDDEKGDKSSKLAKIGIDDTKGGKLTRFGGNKANQADKADFEAVATGSKDRTSDATLITPGQTKSKK